MRFVHHDPVAARRAARVCRDSAADHERIATLVGPAVTGLSWWGRERERVVRDVQALCDDLRHEASALRRSADVLEAAARAAEQREDDLLEAARRDEEEWAAAADAAALQMLLSPEPWSPPPAPSPPRPGPLPAGLR